MRAIAWCRWARRSGWTWRDCAIVLGMQDHTLKEWERRWQENRLAPEPLGKPAVSTSAKTREAIMRMALLLGLEISARDLKHIFPEVPRSTIEELLFLTREHQSESDRLCEYYQLHWLSSGSVWAMDYTFPPNPVDHDRPAILTVRDLASGCILLFAPVRSADADTTCLYLEHLFQTHGPPLVIKADNGSHFNAESVMRLLASYRVTPLFSPPYTPAFNGAVEADQGRLKAIAQDLAARDGVPFHWTSSHLEGAQMNVNNRPRSCADYEISRIPAWAFEFRKPISDDLREKFQQRLRFHLSSIAAETQHELELRRNSSGLQHQQPHLANPAHLITLDSDSLHRRAVVEAMKDLGLYTTRRRFVRLPDFRKERA